MTALFIALQVAATVAGRPLEIDRVCQGVNCESLVVRSGVIQFVDSTPPTRTVSLGKYVAGESLTPGNEATVRDLPLAHGGRIVVSAFIEHADPNEGSVGVRVRFFDARHELTHSEDLPGVLRAATVGRYFGGDDEIFAIMAEEEHAYNDRSELWFLPLSGSPKQLLSFNGTWNRFVVNGNSQPGVRISRETYDGEHAETKGKVQEFWSWSPREKSLRLVP